MVQFISLLGALAVGTALTYKVKYTSLAKEWRSRVSNTAPGKKRLVEKHFLSSLKNVASLFRFETKREPIKSV